MVGKLHSHRVTIGSRRRVNKKKNDMMKKTISKEALNQVFNSYYRDQVRALYRAVSKDR